MKKFIITVLIYTAIYFIITALIGTNCDNCGKKIYGDRYHVEGTSDVICERCARYYK